tara:strand:+ start:1149 stop:1382 length:234 start_codon:yes stop_codon:yes gene_type:complete
MIKRIVKDEWEDVHSQLRVKWEDYEYHFRKKWKKMSKKQKREYINKFIPELPKEKYSKELRKYVTESIIRDYDAQNK